MSKRKQLILIFLLYVGKNLLSGTASDQTGLIKCDAPTVTRGSPANVTCHFDADIDRSRKAFGIDKYDEASHQLQAILRCVWQNDSRLPICFARDGYTYHNAAAKTFSLQIASVEEKHAGTYTCQYLATEKRHMLKCKLKIQPTAEDEQQTTHKATSRITTEVGTTKKLEVEIARVLKSEIKTEDHLHPEHETRAVSTPTVVTRAANTPPLIVVADRKDSAVTFLYGMDFMVVTSVGIISVVIIVAIITISIVRVVKGRSGTFENRHSYHPAQYLPSFEAPLPDEDDRNNDSESREESGFSHESNFYWEVRDDPPTPPPSDVLEPPRPCLRPALPDDYLHPEPSAQVVQDMDDARNVTPLYDNSMLRPVEASQIVEVDAMALNSEQSTEDSLTIPQSATGKVKTDIDKASDLDVSFADETYLLPRPNTEDARGEPEPENACIPMDLKSQKNK